MESKKNKKGITLVALIITIIVLLILAVVSVSLILDEGIMLKAKNAVDKYSEEEIGEQLKQTYSEWQMGQYMTPKVDVQKRLREIYGEETTADINNGILTATINGNTYQYNSKTGISGKYVDSVNYGTKTKETIAPGDDITIGTEKFMVFSKSATEIKAMPYYNLITDTSPVKQATNETAWLTTSIQFSTDKYWELGEDSINMADSRNNIQQYIAEYQTTLRGLGGNVQVRAARYSELSANGVTDTMRNPSGKDDFWIGSSPSSYWDGVYYIDSEGCFDPNAKYNGSMGIRPIIVISL